MKAVFAYNKLNEVTLKGIAVIRRGGLIKDDLRRFSAHTGIILNRLSVVALAVTVICMLSTVFTVLFYVFALIIWFALIIFFVGTILLIEDFRKFPTHASNMFEYVKKITPVIPNIALVGMIISAVSLILMAFDLKWAEAKKRFVFQIVILIASVILFAISFSVSAGVEQ